MSKNACKTVDINGTTYVREDLAQDAIDNTGKPFVIVRSYGAGVFAGYVKERDRETQTIVLDGCVRMWQWTGFTLSQVARDGIAGDGDNKFSIVTNNHEINQVIEVLTASEKARIAIEGVKPWEK